VNVASDIRDGIREIGTALRRPEEFTVRWRDRRMVRAPGPAVFPILLVNAALGLAAYGLTMGFHVPGHMVESSIRTLFAAGLPWLIAFPALYIVNSSLGSRLDASTTFLAIVTTVSFGALAMLASVPINWFFTVMLPYDGLRLVVNLGVFTCVGICLVDVFSRVMKALEPERTRLYAAVWILLVFAITAELMLLLHPLPLDLANAWRAS
jgi:hypothetical protein